MAFNPSSTIFLCNVPFDNTYKHQVYFATQNEQYNYFVSHGRDVVENYLTVRKTLPNGSVQSSVKVDRNIDNLYQCNYMFYQNANHGNKWFYAFITNLIYVNENTTEIVFETDVYQTWLFDVIIKPSFVAREHPFTDEIGANIVPESFNFQEYEYFKYSDTFSDMGEMGYLVTTSRYYQDDGTTGSSTIRAKLMSGLMQGLNFYYFKGDTDSLDTFLSNVETDDVISISVIPAFNLSNNLIGTRDLQPNEEGYGEGWIGSSDEPATKQYQFDLSHYKYFGQYPVKNKKLLTFPFTRLVVTNNSGDTAEYIIEDFNDRSSIQFKMYGDVSVNPSLTLVPLNYKGVAEYLADSVSIKTFPQCSFNTDTWKLWLAKNQFGQGTTALVHAGEIMAGAVLAGTGAGAPLGVGLMVTGAKGWLDQLNTINQAKKAANGSNTGSPQNNLLTAMSKNKFDFYIQQIKEEYAIMIDEFFSMYGYQTNRVKIPNMNTRPYWNFVQTVNINIDSYNDGAFVGGIPCDDMQRLKAVYNDGVTLWNPNATMYDYDQPNHIQDLN